MAMGSFALLLRVLTWWEAAALAGFRAGVQHVRAAPDRRAAACSGTERTPAGSRSGIVLYPAAVLLLIGILPGRPDIVAAAWGVLAAGDGMATLVGRYAGGPRIPWNREKSVAGSVAFVLCGGAAGVALCWWCAPAVTPPPYGWFAIAAPIAARSRRLRSRRFPIRLDDNLTVSLTAAAVMWWLSLVSEAAGVAALARASQLPAACRGGERRRGGCRLSRADGLPIGRRVRRAARHRRDRARPGGAAGGCWSRPSCSR